MEENGNKKNPPEEQFFSGPLTREDLQDTIRRKVSRISQEFRETFEFIRNYPRSVSIFGSARFNENNKHYEEARQLAGRIVRELGYTIFTGGGGGIMEGANRGAFEEGGKSVGLNIRLRREQELNRYTTDSIETYYFFVRKVGLSFAAEAYIFFPGGFGTLDEFFEILTLVQTRKIRAVPIILVGSDFWKPLDQFIKEELLGKHKTINANECELYMITDDEEKILEAIRKTPVH